MTWLPRGVGQKCPTLVLPPHDRINRHLESVVAGPEAEAGKTTGELDAAGLLKALLSPIVRTNAYLVAGARRNDDDRARRTSRDVCRDTPQE